jgi:hypothetical protein
MAKKTSMSVPQAYKKLFSGETEESQIVLRHLMSLLGVTKYLGGSTIEELSRADERRRVGFSIMKHIGLKQEDIPEQVLTELEERMYE